MPMPKEFLQVQLMAISPVAFLLAKEGDRATIRRKPPGLREYREKNGPASEAFLVFKGETKIGMIPHESIRNLGDVSIKKTCRIMKMTPAQDVIVIELFPQ